MKKGYAAKLGKCCLGVYISEELNADIEVIAKKKEVAKSYIVREAFLVDGKLFYEWIDIDNPTDRQRVEFEYYGQQNDLSKAFGSALTYSERYILLKSLGVPTDEDDPDKKSEDKPQAKTKTKREPQTSNKAQNKSKWAKAFIEYAKKESGAHEVKKVFIKPEHKAFRLTKELKSVNYFENDPVTLHKTSHAFFTKKYELTTSIKANRTAFEVRGKYKFDENILYDSQQGTMIVTDNQEHVHELTLTRKLSTHSDGRLFHHCVGEIADAAGVKYDSMVIILRRMFDEGVKYSNKLLSLPTKHLYAFVINNKDLLKADFKESSHSGIQGVISTTQKNTAEFAFPQECVIQYTPNSYKECKKNIYEGYLLSKATKSKVEREFEKWCEKHSDWFYKNGNKGNEYFSILYTNEYGKQKLFYPDYILSINGEIWIIETKGGITYSGADANIDDFSEKKFNALKEYVAKYNLKGGFVVLDEDGLDDELYISTSMFHKIKDNRSEYTLLKDYFN